MLKWVSTLGCALLVAGAADAATVIGAGALNGSRLRLATQPHQQQPQQEQQPRPEDSSTPATPPAPPPASGSISGQWVTHHVGWSGANSFTLRYDAASDVLTSTINGGPALVQEHFLAGLGSGFTGRPLTLLSVGVRDSAISAYVTLSDLTLNGLPVGVAMNGFDGPGFRFWSVNGEDFRQSFTLAGTLTLDPSREGSALASSAIQFDIGASPIPEPAGWALMIGGFGLLGAAIRRRKRTKVAIA